MTIAHWTRTKGGTVLLIHFNLLSREPAKRLALRFNIFRKNLEVSKILLNFAAQNGN